ncbi:GATA zinc finger domain-containing protein [Mycena chlorophos]|uniref:GATA zinc finger domain-containing protein n=1 Tax=Mycena chlorophos TaxID=658473 RepID=A0A8H6W1W3_MYCCL|nr:GATA zinc finger domain-containing protein [Mycena chlorophos]
MSLQTLFAPLPALVDRDEHLPRLSTSSATGRLSLNLGLQPPAGLSLPLQSHWEDDILSASPSSYGPSPTNSDSASPLALEATATSAAVELPHMAFASANSTPHIDLNSLISLDSFGVGDTFSPDIDDWVLSGLPSLHWADFADGSFFPSSPYPSSSATSSGSASPSSYFLSPTLSATEPIAASHAPAPRPAPTSRHKPRPAFNPDGTVAKKECFHCHATSTPLWRREPVTQRPLCNACGLYLQQRNKLRPQALIDADRDDSDDEINRIPDSEYTGPRCSHCNTRQTSVWRRNKEGQQVCNACGVYQRLRGKERPLSLKRNKIKPRTKHTKP